MLKKASLLLSILVPVVTLTTSFIWQRYFDWNLRSVPAYPAAQSFLSLKCFINVMNETLLYLCGKEAFIFPCTEEREEGALMTQRCGALAVGAVRETLSVLPLVCIRSQRGLGQAQEQNLLPRTMLSPPGSPSSVAGSCLLIIFKNRIYSLVLHPRSISVVGGRSCLPQRSTHCSRPIQLNLGSVPWIILQGGHSYPGMHSLISNVMQNYIKHIRQA